MSLIVILPNIFGIITELHHIISIMKYVAHFLLLTKNQHISATSTPKSMWFIQVCKIHLLSMKVKHIAFYTAARNLPFLFTHH